jgi:hypothetical protein
MSLVVRGCESFRVEVDEAKAVRASIVPGSYCGPIVPVLAEPATFDSASRTLRLDVAIANTWTREVTAPMELYAWNDSINIAGSQAPAGGAARRAARLEPSTNAGWNDDATIHSGERWSFELMWNRDGQYSVLPPGMRTPSRELRIRLPAGVSAFTIRLRVQTRNRRSVPAAVAEHPPSWIYADSAHIKNADGMVPVVRNVLDVAFAYGASRESMQAVIDSVQGRIIGGWGSLGAHVIVVKTDGSLEDLKRLEKKLKSMPQVSFADIEMLIPVSPNSYQPEPTKIIRRIPRPPDSTAAPARTPPSSASP